MLKAETVECRARVEDGKLAGVLIQEGRAATGGRREVFAPAACKWPATGVPLRTAHLGAALATVYPVRGDEGRIEFVTPATPELRDRIGSAPGLSVEFIALRESTTAGGVREIQEALVVGASFTAVPEYDQARAELRARRMERRW